MFVIMLRYKKPLDIIDQYLQEHRLFLDTGYQKNFFIASGPQNPRTGGVILSQLKDRDKLENFMAQDPFYIHGLADYVIIEFEAVKYHPDFTNFIL